MSPSKQKVYVFILSDATGLTAERVISAVLVQFKMIKPVFERFPFIKTEKQIDDILDNAERLNAVVIYSFVSKELQEWMPRKTKGRTIYTIDLLGPILKRMASLWNMIPAFRPGLLTGLGEESIRLAESIDFTLKHDDGREIESLDKADIVILGISRTSKTPTSLYLSCNNNLKVANVPLILHMEPPKKIFTLKKRKVGFTINKERLAFIRQQRLKYAGSIDYTDVAYIQEELEYSHKIFRQIKNIQVIDVTSRSIEEIANTIV